MVVAFQCCLGPHSFTHLFIHTVSALCQALPGQHGHYDARMQERHMSK